MWRGGAAGMELPTDRAPLCLMPRFGNGWDVAPTTLDGS